MHRFCKWNIPPTARSFTNRSPHTWVQSGKYTAPIALLLSLHPSHIYSSVSINSAPIPSFYSNHPPLSGISAYIYMPATTALHTQRQINHETFGGLKYFGPISHGGCNPNKEMRWKCGQKEREWMREKDLNNPQCHLHHYVTAVALIKI